MISERAARRVTKSWRGPQITTTRACTPPSDISAPWPTKRNGLPESSPTPHNSTTLGDVLRGQGQRTLSKKLSASPLPSVCSELLVIAGVQILGGIAAGPARAAFPLPLDLRRGYTIHGSASAFPTRTP